MLGIALGMLGAVTTGMSIFGNRKQIKYQQKQKARNDLASRTSYANSVQRASMAKAGYKGEVRFAREAVDIQTQQAEGALRVKSAVAGITGVSVDNALTDIKRQRGREYSGIQSEYELELEKIDIQMRDNIASLDAALRSGQVIDMTSDFASILQISTAGLSGFLSGGGFEADAPDMARQTNINSGFGSVPPISTPSSSNYAPLLQ